MRCLIIGIFAIALSGCGEGFQSANNSLARGTLAGGSDSPAVAPSPTPTPSGNPTSCNLGYTLYGNSCYPTTQSCSVTDGSGSQTFSSGSYGVCQIASCNSGYSLESNACVVSFSSAGRAAILGPQMMGGPAYAGSVTIPDSIYNAFDFPIVITDVNLSTTSASAGDSCFFLNRGGIWQYSASWDGELMCVMSGEQALPNINPGAWNRGVLLNPGERLIFQSTNPTQGGSTMAIVTVGRASDFTSMRRIRFPRWDSTYSVPAGSTLTVGAGCDNPTCAVVPLGPAGPNQIIQSSNSWFVAPVHTAIRGITIYGGYVTATIRVAFQGGVNLHTYNFQLQPVTVGAGLSLGPEAFNFWFGAQQNGSAFVPIDIDVPAGTLVGIDYQLTNPNASVASPIDFAGYLWFDQAVPFTP